jgi:hypothetical protein
VSAANALAALRASYIGDPVTIERTAPSSAPHRIEWLSPREVRVYEGELEAAADLDAIYGRDEWRWGEGTVDIIIGPDEWRTVATFEELLRTG